MRLQEALAPPSTGDAKTAPGASRWETRAATCCSCSTVTINTSDHEGVHARQFPLLPAAGYNKGGPAAVVGLGHSSPCPTEVKITNNPLRLCDLLSGGAKTAPGASHFQAQAASLLTVIRAR